MSNIGEFLKSNGFETAERIDREALVAELISEMEMSLVRKRSSLPMILSYIGQDIVADVRRRIIVLDAGGTNFRSAIVDGRNGIEACRRLQMPGAGGREVSSEEFFATLAEEVERLRPLSNFERIGFCFSYSVESTPEHDACLKDWDKGIRAPGVVGKYIGQELVARTGGSVVLVNDTVTTLLAARAVSSGHDYGSYVGFVLGTGFNVAYAERSLDGMVINSEVGSFDKVPRSRFDLAMDAKQADTGRAPLEKMISGAYLGPLGYEVLSVAAREGLLGGADADFILARDSLSSVEFDRLVSTASSPQVRELGLAVYERAASLAGIALAAFMIRSAESVFDVRPIAVNADGSTYYRTNAISFEAKIRGVLDELLRRHRGLNYEILPEIPDSPMLGAALAAQDL